MTLEMVAQWWCYVTGAGMALGVTAAVWIWAMNRFLAATNNTRMFLQWHWDRIMRGGKIKYP